ncbi:4606_t:CDS:1, partial [Acaulospora morrowiae]
VKFRPAYEDHAILTEKVEGFSEQYVCPKINRDMLHKEEFKVREMIVLSDRRAQTFFEKLHIVTRNPPGISEFCTDDLADDLLRVE